MAIYTTDTRQMIRSSGCPSIVIEEGRYRVKFAENPAEIDAALRLRFEVFNLELDEGLDESYHTFRDEDPFDAQCHHLLVMDKQSGEVIGTYRVQTREMAEAAGGFYSAGEYDLSPLNQPDESGTAVISRSVETGRACIARAHRNGRVLYLLWRGLAAYLTATGKRYLFGCCSLTSQNPAEGLWLMDYLRAGDYVHPKLWVAVTADYECHTNTPAVNAIDSVKIPQLFRIYLGYGAKVCSPPAIDRRFKTIDFLVIMDTLSLTPQVRQMFFR